MTLAARIAVQVVVQLSCNGRSVMTHTLLVSAVSCARDWSPVRPQTYVEPE